MTSLAFSLPQLKKYLRWSVYAGTAFLLLVGACNYWVVQSVQQLIYKNLDEVPTTDVALVLGTSRSFDGRRENPFFTQRVQAAAALFHAGKVKHIIVSGDNSNQRYNEPRDMRKALIKLGVPAKCITMDFAGLRTLDSVVRCKEIFQQQRVTIVSQAFHNARALFIARYHGLDAVAYNAPDPADGKMMQVTTREYLARPKAVLDLYLTHAKPKYLGEKVDIEFHRP